MQRSKRPRVNSVSTWSLMGPINPTSARSAPRASRICQPWTCCLGGTCLLTSPRSSARSTSCLGGSIGDGQGDGVISRRLRRRNADDGQSHPRGRHEGASLVAHAAERVSYEGIQGCRGKPPVGRSGLVARQGQRTRPVPNGRVSRRLEHRRPPRRDVCRQGPIRNLEKNVGGAPPRRSASSDEGSLLHGGEPRVGREADREISTGTSAVGGDSAVLERAGTGGV